MRDYRRPYLQKDVLQKDVLQNRIAEEKVLRPNVHVNQVTVLQNTAQPALGRKNRFPHLAPL